MTIEHRGEVELVVDGEAYTLAAHHAFVSRADGRFGSLGDLGEQLSRPHKMKVADLAAAFRFALPLDHKMAERESVEIVIKAGIYLVSQKLRKVVEAAIFRGRTVEEILEEVDGKKPESSGA